MALTWSTGVRFSIGSTYCCDVDAFGGRPRQFSSPSDYCTLSSKFSTGFFFFAGSIQMNWSYFFHFTTVVFFSLFVLFLNLLICAEHEGANQAPIAAVSPSRKHSRNSLPSALHRALKHLLYKASAADAARSANRRP